jgi:hypothetical protein
MKVAFLQFTAPTYRFRRFGGCDLVNHRGV